jgi:hypothetical protein
VACAFAAQVFTVNVTDLSGGLVTSVPFERVPLGAATQAHNIDFTKQPGSIQARDGYRYMMTFWGADSILPNGLYASKTADLDWQLFTAVDSIGVGYGNVFVSGVNTVDYGAPDIFSYTEDTTAINAILDNYTPPAAQPESYRGVIITLSPDNVDTFYHSNTNVSDPLGALSTELAEIAALINASEDSASYTATSYGDSLLIYEQGATDMTVTAYEYQLRWPASWLPTSGQVVLHHVSGSEPDTSSMIATHVPVTGELHWANLGNDVYCVNGVGRGFIYDGHNSYPFPAVAPGEVSAVPMKTPGSLSGKYRYAISYSGFPAADSAAINNSTDSSGILSARSVDQYLGTCSSPVLVEDGQVMLTAFPPPPELTGTDTAVMNIWRTLGDAGAVDKDLVMYLVGSIALDSSNYRDTVFYDTVSDSNALTDSSTLLYDPLTWATAWHAYDSAGSIDFHVPIRPGAPYIEFADMEVADSGIWSDIGSANTVMGWSWIVVYADTITGMTSRVGPSFDMYQKAVTGYAAKIGGFSRDYTEKAIVHTPRIEDSMSVALVFRGPIIPTAFDTTSINKSRKGGINGSGYNILGQRVPDIVWVENVVSAFDVGVIGYYLVGRCAPGDTICDTLHYGDLLANEPLWQNQIQDLVTNVFAVNDELFTTDGQSVAYTVKDSLIRFGLFDRAFFGPTGNDQLVTIFAQPNGIVKAMSTNRSHLLSADANGDWKITTLAANYGCIAPLSVANAPTADYFLSGDGIRSEQEGTYYEGSYDKLLSSSQIGNLSRYSMTEKRKAFGVYYDGKYILSFPGLDTAVVLQEVQMSSGRPSISYATWDLTMCAAAMYDPLGVNVRGEPDSLVFARPGSNELYVFGASPLDDDAVVNWSWTSGALFPHDGYEYQVSEFTLDVESEDVSHSILETYFIDAGDTLVSDLIVYVARTDTSRYLRYLQPRAAISPMWRLKLCTAREASDIPTGDLSVRSVSVDLTRLAKTRGN